MLNWARLMVKGRVKDIGIPWNDEELHAIHKLGLPFQYVREGCLTVKAFEEAQAKDAKVEKATGEKPIEKMSKDELLGKAKKLGLNVTKHTTESSLIRAIKTKEKK